MGAGASSSSEVGVGINPRVQYTDNRSRNVKKDLVIDTPALVKLDHGTIRYRYTEDEDNYNVKNNRRERNHEGDEREKKHGYFYHTKLNRFGPEANKEKEDEYKFCYVYKGPNKAKQKKIYYVFGRGLKTNAQGFVEPRNFKAQEAYKGPTAYKLHGHVYFDIIFLQQDEELGENVTDEGDIDPSGTQSFTVVAGDQDTAEQIMRRMSIRMKKPVSHIHLFHYDQEMRLSDVVSSLRQPPDGSWKRFRVLLKPK